MKSEFRAKNMWIEEGKNAHFEMPENLGFEVFFAECASAWMQIKVMDQFLLTFVFNNPSVERPFRKIFQIGKTVQVDTVCSYFQEETFLAGFVGKKMTSRNTRIEDYSIHIAFGNEFEAGLFVKYLEKFNRLYRLPKAS